MCLLSKNRFGKPIRDALSRNKNKNKNKNGARCIMQPQQYFENNFLLPSVPFPGPVLFFFFQIGEFVF